MNHMDMIPQWLGQLGLASVSNTEIMMLQEDAPQDEQHAFDLLQQLCQKRFAHTSYWPDFSVLGLAYAIAPKMRIYRPAIFALGVY